MLGVPVTYHVRCARAVDVWWHRWCCAHGVCVCARSQDIESVDPVFYKSLRTILDSPIDDMYLGLTFSADRDEFGARKTVRTCRQCWGGACVCSVLPPRVLCQDDLIPGGSEVDVTDANKREYIRLIAQHRLTSSIRAQIDSFLEGLHDLVPRDLLSIFNENELELILSGLPSINRGRPPLLSCVGGA